jgi:soluble lytic murein transglycosylase-like protein
MTMSLSLCLPHSILDCAECAEKISSTINHLIEVPGKVVHVLPYALNRMKRDGAKEAWKAGKTGDYRIVCDCQVHARKQRAWWRRGLRSMQNASTRAKSGVALLVGLPLVFGASWVPMDAVNSYAAVTRKLTPAAYRARDAAANRSFRIFTTDRTRRDFLTPPQEPQTLTLEISKEAFFRTHVPYGSIIYREAKRNNLPPELVAAVVESESDFRPRLQSNKNALGLMQIVPETGRLMGAENLFNPEENIAAGTKYLRYLFDRFREEKLVLAAYNAGEGNIERFGGVPPFSETLTYIERVVQRRNEYAQRVRGNYIASSRLQKSIAD